LARISLCSWPIGGALFWPRHHRRVCDCHASTPWQVLERIETGTVWLANSWCCGPKCCSRPNRSRHGLGPLIIDMNRGAVIAIADRKGGIWRGWHVRSCAVSTVTDTTSTQPGGKDGECSYSSLFIMPLGGSATPGGDPTALAPAARVSIAGPEHAMPGSTKAEMTRALNSVACFMTDPPLQARDRPLPSNIP
jgi:hypothetical protein